MVSAILFALMLLFSFAAGIHSVKVDSSNSVSYSVIGILSPVNQTYNSIFLTLNFTFGCGMGIQYGVYYRIDGKYMGSIPWVIDNPNETHVVHEASGSLKLPALSVGSHSITVNLEAVGFISGQNPRSYTNAVYFTVASSTQKLESTPPNISDLSVENKTYLVQDVPLNFIVNEKISKITYSLDGEDNVTIAGNTTLTGLPIGAHNLTVYASDVAGNVGASQTVNFTIINMTPMPTPIQASEPFLIMPVAAILLVVLTGSGLGIMALKKHKR
jgi:hypothetical protein